MRDGEVLSGEGRERFPRAFVLRAWTRAAPEHLWAVMDNAVGSEEPTVKERLAKAVDSI